MSTDDVVIGTLTPHGDHMHLEWVCPDCGSLGSVGDPDGPLRAGCSKTGCEYLVWWPEQITMRSATAKNLSEIAAPRGDESCRTKRARIRYKKPWE